MNWFMEPIRKSFDFSGRSRRLEYWLFSLFVFLVSAVAGGLDAAFDMVHEPTGFGPFGAIVTLIFALPGTALFIRRLHDIDVTGWVSLMFYVPTILVIVAPNLLTSLLFLVAFVAFTILALLPGTSGENKYGPSPK